MMTMITLIKSYEDRSRKDRDNRDSGDRGQRRGQARIVFTCVSPLTNQRPFFPPPWYPVIDLFFTVYPDCINLSRCMLNIFFLSGTY